MPSPVGLYLDTARLGLMTPSAQHAVTDFARFTGEVGLMLYGEKFLFEGIESLPRHIRDHFPNLSKWHGVASLKSALLSVVGAKTRYDCVLAGRTLNLVQMAARELAKRCRRVFIPDLAWPRYAVTVRNTLSELGGEVVSCPARDLINKGFSSPELHDRLFSVFEREHCDGAFFPAVSHDGIRLQADSIAETLSQRMRAKLVVIDAAQAVGHVGEQLGARSADIVIAGSHKWLKSGLPLGFAIFRPQARNAFSSCANDDPLFALTSDLKGQCAQVIETVNTWPLFAAMAAANDLLNAKNELPGSGDACESNRRQILSALSGSWWLQVPIDRGFHSAIVLATYLHARRHAKNWRQFFHRRGIALTSYGNSIRLSHPGRSLESAELELLAAALQGKSSVLT